MECHDKYKISQNHDNIYHIRKNYALKSIYDDENECINDTLSAIQPVN